MTLPLMSASSPQPDASADTLPKDETNSIQPDQPVLKMTVKKKLPNGVASNVLQHVVFMLDRSTSMSGEKLRELIMAMQAILLKLADPANKDGFRISIISFNHQARVHCSALPVSEVQFPQLTADGSTNFDAPINEAITVFDAFKSAPNPDGFHFLHPKAFFLSDGQARVADKNIQTFHETANVTAIAYGDDADQNTLSRISSDGLVHAIGTDGGALRDFLSAVGDTMSNSIQSAM
jgi:uncharacterized protein YegL